MRRSVFLALLFCLTGTIPLLANRDDSLRVEFVTGSLSLEPGKMHNLVFKISSHAKYPLNLKAEITLPAGLNLAIPLRTVLLPPGESAVVMVSLNIPARFLAGDYAFRISFTEATTGKLLNENGVKFSVAARDGLGFEFVSSPDYVVGGQDINATWVLQNRGNYRQKFNIQTYNCDVVTPSRVTLDPGESSTVRVVARTSRETVAAETYNFSVEASASDQIRKRDFRHVNVFPDKEEETDLFFRYPVTLTSRYLARGRQGGYYQGYQLEARGSGYIDQNRQHKIEFLARGPNNYDLSFLGLYDEYYLSYENKNFQAFAGHKTYNLTPLLETARYGTGAESAFITDKGSRFGVMYVEPRFYRNIKNEWAAFADIALFKESKAGVYFLTKQNHDASQRAYLGSINATLKPLRSTTAELEYSLGTSEGKRDHAYRIFLISSYKFISISANYYNTGKFYPGYFSNSVFYYGNLNLNLTKGLSMTFSAREDFSNAAVDTLLSTAPYSKVLMASANYRFNSRLNFRAYYLDYVRKDRMPVKQFDYRTNSLNAEFSHNFTKIEYRLGGEYGKTSNYLANSSEAVQQNSFRTNLYLTYRPSYLFGIQGFTSYTNMNSFISPNQKDWIWGLSAYGQPAKNLRTTLQVQNSYSIEEYYLNRNLFQFSVDYTFRRKHKISANSYYMLFQNKTEKPDFTFSVTYSLQIGIPLKKTGEMGSVAGTLTGIDGEPVKGILLYLNGRSAVTGEKGGFSFKNLAPGNYRLSAGRDKLNIDEIPDLPVPFTLAVNPGEVTGINLQLVKAAGIKGKVSVGEETGSLLSSPPETTSLANIVIDLKDDFETKRIITNADGSFDFPLIRPGKWMLRIYKNNVDPRYKITREYFEITLDKGETKKVNIELVPKTRNIIFKSSTISVTGSFAKTEEKTGSKPDQHAGRISLSEIWYTVQVASSSRQIPPGSGELKGESGIVENISGGRYRYFSGRFNTVREARHYREEIKRRFPGVFVVAMKGNSIIPLRDALKQDENGAGR